MKGFWSLERQHSKSLQVYQCFNTFSLENAGQFLLFARNNDLPPWNRFLAGKKSHRWVNSSGSRTSPENWEWEHEVQPITMLRITNFKYSVTHIHIKLYSAPLDQFKTNTSIQLVLMLSMYSTRTNKEKDTSPVTNGEKLLCSAGHLE